MARGYELRHHDEWERVIVAVNAGGTLKKPLRYDDLFVLRSKKQEIRTKEEWEAFKARLERGRGAKKEGSDG
jgi:hypothetical protein